MKIDKGHALRVDRNGSQVTLTVMLVVRGKSWAPEFTWERSNEFDAAVIAEAISDALSDRIREVRAAEYERGYKDGRVKRAQLRAVQMERTA